MENFEGELYVFTIKEGVADHGYLVLLLEVLRVTLGVVELEDYLQAVCGVDEQVEDFSFEGRSGGDKLDLVDGTEEALIEAGLSVAEGDGREKPGESLSLIEC